MSAAAPSVKCWGVSSHGRYSIRKLWDYCGWPLTRLLLQVGGESAGQPRRRRTTEDRFYCVGRTWTCNRHLQRQIDVCHRWSLSIHLLGKCKMFIDCCPVPAISVLSHISIPARSLDRGVPRWLAVPYSREIYGGKDNQWPAGESYGRSQYNPQHTPRCGGNGIITESILNFLWYCATCHFVTKTKWDSANELPDNNIHFHGYNFAH